MNTSSSWGLRLEVQLWGWRVMRGAACIGANKNHVRQFCLQVANNVKRRCPLFVSAAIPINPPQKLLVESVLLLHGC